MIKTGSQSEQRQELWQFFIFRFELGTNSGNTNALVVSIRNIVAFEIVTFKEETYDA